MIKSHLNGTVSVEDDNHRQLVQLSRHSEIVQHDDDHEPKMEDERNRGEGEGQG